MLLLPFTEKAAETLLRMLDASQLVTEEADRQPAIIESDAAFHISAECLSLASTTTLEEAILVIVVSTFVFNLKVTRRLRNVTYFVERHIMMVEAEVPPTASAKKELELLSKIEWRQGVEWSHVVKSSGRMKSWGLW